ncbi:MAG: 50S ribosomal protein L24 [Patescibacteria group bacterium]|nr:50S ribosomal protein L24 [Patescibacteria group bacterium]
MIKFKKGDTVKITSGKDKGRGGKIESIFPEESKVLIPGINMYKKHVKGSGEQKGGIYDLPRPISFSKIALVCPKCKKNTRVGFKFVDDQKVRICKKCKKEINTK